ncbi:glycosyltransferase family 4 protein [Vibrio coralliilyticus]|uniref:glycosyltransferase family 4 protein n=1 Tax=Vibrio coralliilyticus TaxID=190893 RepID=UPI00148D3018|nr:glycosyltransferase family 4 protein [Vibrio coralliilyticus]NOH54518.1 glycosyltransferase family 4 protein [Vibrio coralliilyticus]
MILSLFFTRGVSLDLWFKKGLLEREKLIYERHLELGNLERVYWFTYGSSDKKLAEELIASNNLHRYIEVYDMPKIFSRSRIGIYFYSLLLPFYHRNIIRQSDVIRTNQIDGSWSAVLAHLIFDKKLIIRSGYTPSQLTQSKGRKSIKYYWFRLVEKFAYKFCNRAIVASENNKKYIIDNNNINPGKIDVVKNFVDTKTFKNRNIDRHSDRLLFVGRLNKEKNLYSLIKAISSTNYILDVYGAGELQNEVSNYAKELGVKVNFNGVVPNSQLASVYNSYKYYILTSHFEGMPKTLLEAMACGCVCIGTNVNGINEVISDQVDGILCEDTSAQAIANKLTILNINNMKHISENAVLKIEKFYSLDSIVELDLRVIKSL